MYAIKYECEATRVMIPFWYIYAGPNNIVAIFIVHLIALTYQFPLFVLDIVLIHHEQLHLFFASHFLRFVACIAIVLYHGTKKIWMISC